MCWTASVVPRLRLRVNMINYRVHAALDGELPREELTPKERRQLASLETALERATAPVRDSHVPDLTSRVMAALPEAAPDPVRAPVAVPAASIWQRFGEWLWSPRVLTLQYRPGMAMAGFAVAALAAVVLVTGSEGPSALPPVAEVPAEETPHLYVQFRLEADAASEVRVAGSFTGWEPEVQLQEVAPGVWSAMVPLEPGVHDYTFVIDGERWVVDPYAPRVEDSFGGSNSRLFLPPPAEHA